MMRHHPAVMATNNCDYPPQANYSGDYQGGYNEDSVARQMIIAGNPPMFTAGPEMGGPVYSAAQMRQRHSMYSMSNSQSMVDVMVERDRFGNPLHQLGGGAHPMQDSAAFTHIL